MMTPRSVKPLVVSSANGHRYKNGGTKTCIETAYEAIVKGEDVLDAVIAGVGDAEVLVPRRQTFYGMDEIFVRPPCGTVVGFAASVGEEE